MVHSASSHALRKWLESQGMSQGELAARMGLSARQVVYRWLAGTRRPTLQIAGELDRLTDGQVRASGWNDIARSNPRKKAG